jgi:hypothetical protein
MSTSLGITVDDTAGGRAERSWRQVLPDLPDEVIALLAAPVVVDQQRDQRAAAAPARPRSTGADCTPRFLPPTPRSR